MHSQFQKIINKISCFEYSRLLRPIIVGPTCILCQHTSDEIVCRYCLEDCEVSSFPSPGENLLEHPSIMKNRVKPLFHQLHAIGWHDDILARLIYQLKFSRQHLTAKALALFFHQYVLLRLSQFDDLPDAMIPVPISNLRLLQRGYNQAQMLAEYIFEYYPIQICRAVEKTRHTKQQSRMPIEHRLSNVSGAFRIKHDFEARHVCIVDDVLTTGTTVNQISEALLAHKPDLKISVWCMTLAKFES